MQTEPEQWAVEAWERYGPMIFNCEITGPEVLQLVVEERERKLRKFNLGDRVTKTKGSSWTGLVVGFYSTSLTPIGYAVESENEPGSVQIYPESALASDPLLDRQGE